VSSHGRAGTDQPGAAVQPTGGRSAAQVVKDVQAVGGAAGQGGGTLFTEPVLVVSQKAKIIEVNQEYAVYDQHGRQIGGVRQVGQSTLKKAARLLSNVDNLMTHKFQVIDGYGQVVLMLTKPRQFMKGRLVVQDAAGNEVGHIVQQNMIGKIRFSLESGGYEHGSINAENWRAWNFNIQDHTGTEIARVTKKFAGLLATFTTADNYVVQIHRPLEEPLRSLVVAAALGIDNLLHQNDAAAIGT
jgi:uncharacterized protein YxjI